MTAPKMAVKQASISLHGSTRPKTSMFYFCRLLIKCSFLLLVGWRPHNSDEMVRHRGPTLRG